MSADRPGKRIQDEAADHRARIADDLRRDRDRTARPRRKKSHLPLQSAVNDNMERVSPVVPGLVRSCTDSRVARAARATQPNSKRSSTLVRDAGRAKRSVPEKAVGGMAGGKNRW